MTARVVHVLFAGLGGHGAVVMPLLDAPALHGVVQEVLFVGDPPVRPEYVRRCVELGITWSTVSRSGVAAQSSLLRALHRHHPDVVIVHAIGAVVAGAVLRTLRPAVRLVVVVHQAAHLQDRKYRILNPLALLAADRVVALSRAGLTSLRSAHRLLARRAPIVVVPNGCDTTTFRPAEPPPRPPLRIGMQSRLAPIKDHETLIDAVAIMRASGTPVELHIAGGGSHRPHLEGHVRRRGLDQAVTFHGTLDEPELVVFLQSLHLYVHATHGEAMSTAVLQAMAVGLPVVASDVPGLREIAHQHGVPDLVPESDPAALATHLCELSERTDLARELGTRCRRAVTDHYTTDQVASRYRALIDDLVGARNTP